jgi:isoamylase
VIMPQRELHDYIFAICEHTDVRVGSSLHLGTQEMSGGVNFAIFARDAARVRLELKSAPDAKKKK